MPYPVKTDEEMAKLADAVTAANIASQVAFSASVKANADVAAAYETLQAACAVWSKALAMSGTDMTVWQPGRPRQCQLTH